ncbi:hypothetical protein [Haloplanus sp.]|nr:hypothetical protein [Haloplanus sp.]
MSVRDVPADKAASIRLSRFRCAVVVGDAVLRVWAKSHARRTVV